MSPQLEEKGVKESLQEALAAAENQNTRYHIREALQMTQLDS